MVALTEVVKSYVAPATITVTTPDTQLMVSAGKTYPLSPVSSATANAVYASTSSGSQGQGTVTGIPAGNPTWGIQDYQGKVYATNAATNGSVLVYQIEAGTVKSAVSQATPVMGMSLWVVVAVVAVVGVILYLAFRKK